MQLRELTDEQYGTLKKIVSAASDAKQAWQLGHRDRQARAGLEAHQDAVTDELNEAAQPQ